MEIIFIAKCWTISNFPVICNQRLLRETELRFITSIVYQHQLQLYGHATQKLVLFVRWSLKIITQSGGDQGDPAHKICGWGKSIILVGSYLVREWGLHGHLHGVVSGVGVEWWVRSCATQHMPPIID